MYVFLFWIEIPALKIKMAAKIQNGRQDALQNPVF
jgi:hypothetical protein